MNWNQLQYIVTTAQEGSVTRAAQRLFISQPSLTLSIQNLEKELGIKIFEKSRGTLSLTYAGRLYYDWALSTLHSRERLEKRFTDIREQRSFQIRLGISPHRSAILLPPVLERFYDCFPDAEISLEERPTYQLRTMLEEEKLDLMIDVPHPDSLTYQNTVLAREHLVLAVPETFLKKLPEIPREACMFTMDPEGKTDRIIPIQSFSAFPFFMLGEPQNLAALSRRIYERAGFLPSTRLVCSGITTALALTEKQLGLVLAPEIYSHPGYAREGIRFFRMAPGMAGELDVRQICLVFRKDLYLHAGLRALMDLFIQEAPLIYGEDPLQPALQPDSVIPLS